MFFFLLLQQLEIRPCYIYIRISKDTNIMISETFMHLQASLFDHNHLWCHIYYNQVHHITSVFVKFIFFSYLIFFPGHQRALDFWTLWSFISEHLLQSGNWCMCSCGSVVEHCASSAKGCGFNSQGTPIRTKKCIAWMYCKSLWIKPSDKCGSAAVRGKIMHRTEESNKIVVFVGWSLCV